MKKKLRLKQNVKDTLVCISFSLFCVIGLYVSIVVGDYRHNEYTKKSTDVVPVQTVQNINNHS